MKILVVEDDPLLSNLLSSKLEREGHTVEHAFNGKEGLEKIEANKPEAIILDVTMPVMTGFEMLREMKNHVHTRSIPVILFSNLGEKECNLEEGKRLGADAFLNKSQLSLSDVVTKINEIVGGRKVCVRRVIGDADGGRSPHRARGGSARSE